MKTQTVPLPYVARKPKPTSGQRWVWRNGAFRRVEATTLVPGERLWAQREDGGWVKAGRFYPPKAEKAAG